MKNSFVFILFTSILILFLFGCKKEKNTSIWTINGSSYSAKATSYIGKAESILSSNDFNNRFDLTFYLDHLPQGEGKTDWLMVNYNPNQNPSVAELYFYWNGIYYYLSTNETVYLKASDNKGKAKYELNGAWFLNSNNASDSVWVTATLNQP